MTRDSAVSPVIGSILLVAITVIIAAVIAAFVLGIVGGVQTGKIVAVTAQKVTGSAGTPEIHLTNHGGPDASLLVSGAGAFTVTLGGSAAVATGLTNVVGSVGVISTGVVTGPQRVTVVGHFTDGTSQVVLDKTT